MPCRWKRAELELNIGPLYRGVSELYGSDSSPLPLGERAGLVSETGGLSPFSWLSNQSWDTSPDRSSPSPPVKWPSPARRPWLNQRPQEWKNEHMWRAPERVVGTWFCHTKGNSEKLARACLRALGNEIFACLLCVRLHVGEMEKLDVWRVISSSLYSVSTSKHMKCKSGRLSGSPQMFALVTLPTFPSFDVYLAASCV